MSADQGRSRTTPENVDARIDAWHDGADGRSLHEALGWTWDQYKTWVERDQFPAVTTPNDASEPTP